jgi:ribonucleotide reductase beta subunit family protein with ferritin-like domain
MRNLLTKKTSYTFDYPEALVFADKQNSVFWTFDEIDLEKDVHSILTDFTPSERHGVTTALKLFTKYELIVGNEYWSGTVKPNFQHPDIELMADAFCYFESNVHARFYNRINELLGLATAWQHQGSNPFQMHPAKAVQPPGSIPEQIDLAKAVQPPGSIQRLLD